MPPKKSKAGWNPPPSVLDAFYNLMAADPANLPRPDEFAALVRDLFLRHSEQRHSPDTFGNNRHFLQSFCVAHGRLPVSELKPFHATRRLDDHPKWKGGRRHAVIAAKRASSRRTRPARSGPTV